MNKAIVIEATGLVENIIVIEAEAVYDPGPGKIMLDVADAKIGGTWNGTVFLPPPPRPAPPTQADRAEQFARGNPALLAMMRIVTGNDNLTEEALIGLLKAKLP